MSVGATSTQAEVNATAAQVARSLFNTMRSVEQFKAWLDTQSESDLTARGFTSGEVAVLKSALGDLDTLRTVFEGTATQGTAYDFRTFSKLLLGCGLY